MSRATVGVGFISSFPSIDDLVQVALDEHVAAINHSFADPTPYVAAAQAAGVKVMGTRFVASEEWGGGAWEQRAVLAASADDTVRTSIFDLIRAAPFPEGVADRVLRNAFTASWHGREAAIAQQRAELQRTLAEAGQRGDATVTDVSAGVSAGLIRTVEPAGEIVRQTVREAEQVMQARCSELLRPSQL